MKQEIESVTQVSFEKMKKINEQGQEYWSSRELARTLGYSDYRNFQLVIQKAKDSCNLSGYNILDHFVDSNDMVDIGSGAKRETNTVNLSRYACYLIVQNSDPSKPIVALGQTYFAVQTRKQEIIEEQAYGQLKSEDENGYSFVTRCAPITNSWLKPHVLQASLSHRTMPSSKIMVIKGSMAV